MSATQNIPKWKQAYHAHLKSPKWRALRIAKLNSLPNQCQKCGSWNKRLEVHHLTYERLGNELMDDLMILCGDCHAFEDKLRALESQKRSQEALSSAWYNSGRDTYMTKKYGPDWDMYYCDSSEYDEWLERRGHDE